MSTVAVPLSAVPPARRWQVVATYLFLFGVFYLADPLDVFFSRKELVDLESSTLTAKERAESNVEHREGGSLARQAALLALAAYGLYQLGVPSHRRVRVRGLLGASFVFFLAWCAATVAWSEQPLTTVRKLTVLACLCVGAIGTARRFTLRDLVSLTLFGCGLVLAGGILGELALGTFRPWKASYRFSGLTWPAFSAWTASLFLLAAMTRLREPVPYRLPLVAAALAALVLLGLTKTRASVGAFVLAAGLFVCLTWPARRLAVLAVVLCLAGSLAGLAAELGGGGDADSLANVANMGRTESAEGASGRAGVWAALWPYIEARPRGGYGYETFWTPRRLLEIGEDNWGAPDAHNSFINLALGIGVVGSAAYALVLLLGLGRAWTAYRRTADGDFVFVFCVVVVLLVNALFVSTPLSPTLYAFITLALLARLGFIEPATTSERRSSPPQSSPPA